VHWTRNIELAVLAIRARLAHLPNQPDAQRKRPPMPTHLLTGVVSALHLKHRQLRIPSLNHLTAPSLHIHKPVRLHNQLPRQLAPFRPLEIVMR
jgi:hypothetical protein